MLDNLPIATILVSYVSVLFALSVHEAAHATAAYWLEDDTAKRLGRMTLNPIAHIDIIGTVVMPLLGAFTGFRVLGWAKPVPVDPMKLTRKFRMRVGFAMVAAAGPASNLLQSLFFLVILGLFIRFFLSAVPVEPFRLFRAAMYAPVESLTQSRLLGSGQVLALALLGRLVSINVGLALFNLLPVGPLDGGGILRGFLPYRMLPGFDRIQPTLSIVLLVLFLVGVMDKVLWPLYAAVEFVYVHPLARLVLGV